MNKNQKKPRIQVIPVDYGIASRYNSGVIEINRKLRGNLKKSILVHERRHESGKYSLKDFKNDFNSKKPHFFKAFLFSLRNPEAMINYFPFMYSYYLKRLTFNSTSLLPFIQFGVIFTLFFYFLFKISPINAFLGYIYIYFIINIILLAYTHLYVSKQAIS